MLQLDRVYEATFFSEHSQLLLRDATTEDALLWGTDETEVIFSPTGTAFTVRNDANVRVIIYRGNGKPGGRLVGAGTITVGGAGLEIGNLFSDSDLFPWPSGNTTLAVYLHSRQEWMARKVSVVLQPENGPVPAIDETPTGRAIWLLKTLRLTPGLHPYTVASALRRLGTGALTLMIENVTDADARVRAAVVQALGLIGDSRAVPTLLSALTDDDAAVHHETILALGRLRDRRATEPLLILLATSDTQSRGVIIDALGQLRDKRIIVPVRDILNDTREDRFARESAARALGNVRATGILPDLAHQFRHGDDDLRNAIGQAFYAIGKAAFGTVLELAGDPDPAVRRMVASNLMGWSRYPVIEPLSILLRDPVPAVRITAAAVLDQRRDAAIRPLLQAALHDSDETVRRIAAAALETWG